MVTNIFFQSVACLFIFLVESFIEQKLLIFMKSNLSIFILWIMLSVSSPRNLCLDPTEFLLFFLSFMVYICLCYIFNFLIMCETLEFNSFAFWCLIASTPFVEKAIFSIESLLHLCQKTIGQICGCLFLGYYSVPLIHVFLISPISYSF